MPPASAVTQAGKAERDERLREALKSFILKERQRKKEEYEAEVEEERLRKEREARERQDVMTLGETREQITKLDQKLTELRNQKQQLFLQLKKVLNEDENRKKQQQQKDSELFAMQAMQAQNVPQPQVFLPQRLQHQHQQILQKVPVGVSNQGIKRNRSPSPPQHQAYYKSAAYPQPKHDDGRRGADIARVLWNKPPTQYQNPPGTLFYQTASNAPSHGQQDNRGPAIIYPSYNPNLNLPLRQSYHMEMQPQQQSAQGHSSKNDQQSQKPPAQVYHINLDQPPISQASGSVSVGSQHKPQVTMEKISDRYHVELKVDQSGHGPPQPTHLPEGVVYTSLISGMPMHPGVMQMTGNPQQNNKPGGSITQGYSQSGGNPGHPQQQQQQQQQMPGQQQRGQQLHFRRLY
ncbi:G protein pathway suppressor 2 isoform X2 [Episyrphus balteatus]|uniref:G protein pathway suppressor 2 isoform X2 n=1 Tax=Episyrphus balteatus TaxID=286459 RepID=UPI0024867230|nr:G protein pathway suppressor 2 isoform X2 [Episyrphus balteatus]